MHLNKMMWKQVFSNRNTFLRPANVRYFLSDSFKCTEAWQNRLNSPILQNIRPDLFYHELERKFVNRGKVCAIDMDIFANALKDNAMLSELSDLMHKLRLTAETSNTLDSTTHATIRHHLDHSDNDMTNLIFMLDDPLNYGLFLDAYTANLCLDKMIKLQEYQMAAKVATFLMLQENFENPINRNLSLYACYKYLENPQPFSDLFKEPEPEIDPDAEKVEQDAAADPKAKKVKRKEKKEEIKIRINYIRNPYFDDHFDIKNSHHLVGKTFLSIGMYLDGAIGNTVKLLGYSYYEKFVDGVEFIESLKGANALYKDAFKKVQEKMAQITDRDKDESFLKFRSGIEKLSESIESMESASFETDLHKLATDAVEEHESAEIEEQKKMYDVWNQIREIKLKEELKRVDHYNRSQNIESLKSEMQEREQLLWFFENEEQIELEIEKRKTVEVKKVSVSRGERKKMEDSYVPPEVKASRN